NGPGEHTSPTARAPRRPSSTTSGSPRPCAVSCTTKRPSASCCGRSAGTRRAGRTARSDLPRGGGPVPPAPARSARGGDAEADARRVQALDQRVAHGHRRRDLPRGGRQVVDRKSTRLNSSHVKISYAVFCLKNK